MVQHTCDTCGYSTHRKDNYNRHLTRHNQPHLNQQQPQPHLNQQQPHLNQQQQQQQHQQQPQQLINTQWPQHSQNINLSNQINVPPPTPQQVINIQPPQQQQQQIPNKKPIIYGESAKDEFFDIRLKENFKMFISGPSRSGKTVFIKDLLKNLNIFSKQPPQKTVIVYQVFQDIYRSMNVDFLLEDCSNITEKIFEISNGISTLVIFDDFLKSNALADVANLFIVDGRHRNLSMAFIGQNIFVNDDNFRLISQNCDYYVLFKNPRNIQQVRTLATQMSSKMELLTHYMRATKNPFSYLFINLTQECKQQVKYLSHLFNQEHVVKSYGNKYEDLVDEMETSQTNFSRMKFSPTQSKSSQMESVPTKDNSTNTFPAEMKNASVGSEIESVDESIQPNPMNTEERGVGPNFIMRDQTTNTFPVKTKEMGVGSNFIMRDQTTNTFPVKTKNASVGSELSDQSTQLNPVDTRDFGTGGEMKFDKSSDARPVYTKNASVGTINHQQATQTLQANTRNVGVGVGEKINKSFNTTAVESADISVGDGNQITYDNYLNDASSDDVIVSNNNEIANDPSIYLDYRKYLEKPRVNPKDTRRFDRGERDLRLNSFAMRNRRRTVDADGDIQMNNSSICGTCGEEFDTIRALNIHQRSCDIDVFACGICGKNLPTRRALNSHKIAMHQTRRDVRELT